METFIFTISKGNSWSTEVVFNCVELGGSSYRGESLKEAFGKFEKTILRAYSKTDYISEIKEKLQNTKAILGLS